MDTGFEAFGEVTDRKTRAELLDEGLEILTGLWHGQPFNFNGKHYTVKETSFFPPPPPVQQPRIPIWVVGAWPREKSMQRALRYDGLLPQAYTADGKIRPAQPADLAEIIDYITKNRTADTPYEIIVEGTTPGDDPALASTMVKEWATAGATWWIEALWDANQQSGGSELVHRRLLQGPPHLY